MAYLVSYTYDKDSRLGFGNVIFDDPLKTVKDIRSAEKKMREDLCAEYVIILNIIELVGEE